jgi:hypothetical protein
MSPSSLSDEPSANSGAVTRRGNWRRTVRSDSHAAPITASRWWTCSRHKPAYGRLPDGRVVSAAIRRPELRAR